jgi:hypothetical protein
MSKKVLLTMVSLSQTRINLLKASMASWICKNTSCRSAFAEANLWGEARFRQVSKATANRVVRMFLKSQSSVCLDGETPDEWIGFDVLENVFFNVNQICQVFKEQLNKITPKQKQTVLDPVKKE